jgi:hypothetical protein
LIGQTEHAPLFIKRNFHGNGRAVVAGLWRKRGELANAAEALRFGAILDGENSAQTVGGVMAIRLRNLKTKEHIT